MLVKVYLFQEKIKIKLSHLLRRKTKKEIMLHTIILVRKSHVCINISEEISEIFIKIIQFILSNKNLPLFLILSAPI